MFTAASWVRHEVATGSPKWRRAARQSRFPKDLAGSGSRVWRGPWPQRLAHVLTGWYQGWHCTSRRGWTCRTQLSQAVWSFIWEVQLPVRPLIAHEEPLQRSGWLVSRKDESE